MDQQSGSAVRPIEEGRACPLIVESLGRGDPWTLTPTGEAEAARALAVRTPPSRGQISEGDLLAHFKPKSSLEYRARVEGRELVKTRQHARLLKSYGEDMSSAGWRPRTNVHPRDLELSRRDSTWLLEFKTIRPGNFTQAAREALAQLLEYRHFFYPTAAPGLLALFTEPTGTAH